MCVNGGAGGAQRRARPLRRKCPSRRLPGSLGRAKMYSGSGAGELRPDGPGTDCSTAGPITRSGRNYFNLDHAAPDAAGGTKPSGWMTFVYMRAGLPCNLRRNFGRNFGSPPPRSQLVRFANVAGPVLIAARSGAERRGAECRFQRRPPLR